MENQKLKKCKKCKLKKDFKEFYKTSSGCKSCHSKHVMKNQQDKKDYYNKYRNDYSKKKTELKRALKKSKPKPKYDERQYRLEYYAKNRDLLNAKSMQRFWQKRLKNFEADKLRELEMINKAIADLQRVITNIQLGKHKDLKSQVAGVIPEAVRDFESDYN